MNHISLFNGIGGFQLAAEWMGWNNLASCEIDPFCNRVTKYHFPNCIQHEDIKTTDFTIYRGRIDILTGGFPCQPYSLAGKRLGKDDDRHLWPEMFRAVREIQPDWVVGENVRGLINWNGGLVFDEVQADLEAAGYEVFPFLLPAAGVNAPHERYRIWFVAYSNTYDARRCRYGKIGQTKAEGEIVEEKWERIRTDIERIGDKGTFTNSTSTRQQNSEKNGSHLSVDSDTFKQHSTGESWKRFPLESPFLFGNDGLSTRLDGITFSKWRSESIKAAGNAIVPQVALQLFKAIEAYQKLV